MSLDDLISEMVEAGVTRAGASPDLIVGCGLRFGRLVCRSYAA